ncbi:hypothetical protein DFH09DRAFT_1086706 [Mycena vulgaris]|nr:hypothetical protein DFH09DRAFT_1086706 [Mycena vulgaris]
MARRARPTDGKKHAPMNGPDEAHDYLWTALGRILRNKLPKDGLEEAQSRLQPASRNEEDSEEHLAMDSKVFAFQGGLHEWPTSRMISSHHRVCDPFGIDVLVPTAPPGQPSRVIGDTFLTGSPVGWVCAALGSCGVFDYAGFSITTRNTS